MHIPMMNMYSIILSWSPHFETTQSDRKKYGLNLMVVLKWNIENIRVASLMEGLKIEGHLNWRGIKCRDHWTLLGLVQLFLVC